MKKVLLIALTVIMVSGILLMGCAQPAPAAKPATPAPTPTPAAPKPIELRFSFHVPPGSATNTVYLTPWAKKVEEATKGKVKITTYPAESLNKADKALESVMGGVADMAWIVMGYWEGRFPLSSVMLLPFIVPAEGKKDGKRITDSAVGGLIIQALYEKFPEIQKEWQDVKVLYLLQGNALNPNSVAKPIRNMNDLNGMKMRQDGAYPQEMYKRLGASPVFMPLPEIYTSLEKGVIQGTSASVAMLQNFKLYEVLKYRTNVATTCPVLATIMNNDKWNSLPKDVQDGIMSVSGSYGSLYAGETWGGFGELDNAFKMFEKAGKPIQTVELDPGEYDKWVEIAGTPIYEKWLADMKSKGLPGQAVLDEALRLKATFK
jgi:TRAP-type C4-dicarboxylate transport system substrate-binding protein